MGAATGDRLMNGRQVRIRNGIKGRATLHRWYNDPDIGFPRPAMVISGRNYWRESDVERWHRERAAMTEPPRAVAPAPSGAREVGAVASPCRLPGETPQSR
jgi:predicted DNA-binding transcriptional regulator AlpA